MNKYFKFINDKLTFDLNFIYKGSIDDLRKSLNSYRRNKWKDEAFYSKRINANQYDIIAFISLGTLNIEGVHHVLPIKCHIYIEEENQTQQKVNIKTNLRPESVLLIIIGFIATFTIKAVGGSFWQVLGATGAFILCFLWFNLIYKAQEETLINIIVKKLKLRRAKLEMPISINT